VSKFKYLNDYEVVTDFVHVPLEWKPDEPISGAIVSKDDASDCWTVTLENSVQRPSFTLSIAPSDYEGIKFNSNNNLL
jgi:hypothetical protein